MVDSLNLRIKLLSLGAVPAVVLVAVAAISASTGSLPGAAAAVAGAVAVAVAAVQGSRAVGDRADELVILAARLALDGDVEPSPRRDQLARVEGLLAAVGERIETLHEAQLASEELSIGEIVSSLAERVRDLLDRQLAHIDWLEATEQDPIRLEQLFELDHLAYQLRRSAESMVIAGGREPTSYTGGPTPITDVLRVAIGTVEAYRTVRLKAVDDVLVAGQPSFELAQMVAELIDNAARFSLDDSPVEVLATSLDDGDYRVTVIDHGVGMDHHLLATTNQVVADPPGLDAVGDAIGLVVVGRLARRIGATVDLSSTPEGGVTAQVIVPASVIVADVPGRTSVTREARSAKRERRRRVPRRRAPNPDPVEEAVTEAARSGTSSMPDGVARLLGLGSGGRSRSLDEAVPSGDAFDDGVEGLLAGGTPGGRPGPAPAWQPPVPTPGHADLGLVRRTRGARPSPITAGRPGAVGGRRPDEAPSTISWYRDGLRPGAPPLPPARDGSDAEVDDDRERNGEGR